MKYIKSYFLVDLFKCPFSIVSLRLKVRNLQILITLFLGIILTLSNSNCMKQKLVHKSLEAIFLITCINYMRVSGDGIRGTMSLLLLLLQLTTSMYVYDIVSFRRPHEVDFIGLIFKKVDSYVSKLNKGCRNEAADTHILNL